MSGLAKALAIIISIHTSPKGGDSTHAGPVAANRIFQSTPPRREVTKCMSVVTLWVWYFNPHLPEGR